MLEVFQALSKKINKKFYWSILEQNYDHQNLSKGLENCSMQAEREEFCV
jgi:hypothetical protein